jgi:hypothetical protein
MAQFVDQFISAPADGFRMEAGDFRDPLEPAMSQTQGLTPRHPATLLLIQPAQQ